MNPNAEFGLRLRRRPRGASAPEGEPSGSERLRNSEFKTFEKKDFPGEAFRVLKEKEEKQYGEYRTRRLVLEAWDKMELMHKSNGAPWDCWEG